MTSPTLPPKRSRRRRLIAAVVLVLASTAACWYWPRGDARFVGSWDVHLHDFQVGTLELWANGRGVVRKTSRSKPSYLFWTTTGDSLHVGVKPPGLPSRFWPTVVGALWRTSGISTELFPATLEAVSIEPGVIEFKDVMHAQPFAATHLRRISK